MNDQAKNWVWDQEYEEKIKKICTLDFRFDFATAQDVAQDILFKLFQCDGPDEIDKRSAWIKAVARNTCIDHLRKLKRHPDWKGESLEELGVGADEKLSDAKLDKEARGSTHDIEKEIDEPKKIDPLYYLQLFVRDDPKIAEELDRSFFYVLEAFGQIGGKQRSLKDIERIGKVLVALRDMGGRSEKILSNIEYVHSSSWDDRHNFQPLSAFIRQQIKELILRMEAGLRVGRPNMLIDFGDPRFATIMDPHLIRYYSRWPRDFTCSVPDLFYILYRIWNQILRRGSKSKYGNRRMLKMLLLGYKKLYAGYKYIDTFNSLTEETNFETLRVMGSHRLNKGYSELADFIFKITTHPPSCAGYKKIGSVWYLEFDARRTPTDEKKPAPLSST